MNSSWRKTIVTQTEELIANLFKKADVVLSMNSDRRIHKRGGHMKRMSRFGAAVTVAVMLASGLAASTARLEGKGDGDGGGTTALCSALLSVVNDTNFPQAIRDAAQRTFDLLGCS